MDAALITRSLTDILTLKKKKMINEAPNPVVRETAYALPCVGKVFSDLSDGVNVGLGCGVTMWGCLLGLQKSFCDD